MPLLGNLQLLPHFSGQRMLLEHEGIMALASMLWESHSLKDERNCGFSMDALVSVCSWNTNGFMVLAWLLWSANALGPRTELWFWHGCSGQRMLMEHERNYGFGMDALGIALVKR